MVDYTLHCFVESGNAYKAALMLQLCGLDWKPQWVDFFNGETRTADYREINPMGEVPVLIDHQEADLPLTQTGVILYHLGTKTKMYLPETDAEKRQAMRWILFDNHKLTGYIATYRFLKRFANKDGDPETEFMKGRALSALKVFDAHMKEHDWVISDRPTIADISCCGYLFWPDHIDLTWNDYPGIKAWIKRLKTLDNWASPEDLLPSGPQENT